MKKKTLFGTAITVIMIVLVSIAPSINANADTLSVETPQEENATPIVLVFQLIVKLRNHRDIQNIESEDDVLRIIEGDEELNSIVEQLSGKDCGCDDSKSLEWGFPIICFLLIPFVILGWIAVMNGGPLWLGQIVYDIGSLFGCNWA